MKTYTIPEATTEISLLFKNLNPKQFAGILYEDGTRNKFVLTMLDGCKYFINLDAGTHFKISL